MMQKNESVSLPELNKEYFKNLPQGACVAFTFRAAVRVLPLLANKTEILFYKESEKNIDIMFTALDLGLVWSGKRGDVDHLNALVDVVDGLVETAVNHYVAGTVSSVVYAAHAVDGTAYSLAYAAAESAYSAAESVEMIAEYALNSMRSDLSWLMSRSGAKEGWSQSLAEKFLSRPIWQPEEKEVESHSEWRTILAEWQSFLYSNNRVPLVERHHAWMYGRIEPLEVVERRLNEWYERQKASAESDSSQAAQKQAPIVEEGVQEEGIVEDVVQNKAFAFDVGEGVSEVAAEAASEVATDLGAEPGAEELHSGQLGEGIVTAKADKPSDVDNLGRESLVNTLADMLASPNQSLPMTIALLGDWGAGKSSIIAQLKRRLNEVADSWVTVRQRDQRIRYLHAEFNAWEYEQTDNIRAGLAQEVVNGLLDKLSRWQKISFAFANAWQQHRWEFGWSLFGFVAVTLAMVAAGTTDLNALGGATGSFVGVGAAAVFSFVLYNAWKTARNVLEHPLANQLRTYLKLPSYGKHLGLVPVIRQQIKSLCEHRLRQIHNGRLLVVIDDLDRCSPECITQTLDAIRLVMDLENVAVVIAIDDRVAFRAVAEHYKKLGDESRPGSAIARDYLGKIIQLPINLPQPGMPDMEGFIRNSLFQVKDKPKSQSRPELKVVPSIIKKQSAKEEPATPDKPQAELTLVDEVEKNEALTNEPEEEQLMVAPEQPMERNKYRIERVTKSFEKSQKEMEDSAEELNWFEELTRIFGFSNPRQLIRLKNSYRFLKGAYHGGEGGGDGANYCWAMMIALFWSEQLYQTPFVNEAAPTQARRHLEVAMWNFISAKEQSQNEFIIEVGEEFKKVFSEMQVRRDYYFELMGRVAMVVMPSAHGGLFLSRAELEGYKESLEK